MTRVEGMDGFWPIGPGIVRGIDIRDSAVRTYLNGSVVQEDAAVEAEDGRSTERAAALGSFRTAAEGGDNTMTLEDATRSGIAEGLRGTHEIVCDFDQGLGRVDLSFI